jgi:CubicO group peptidase (beta-lactamase class C family)
VIRQGHAAAGFERVRDAFWESFDGQPQMGAALAIVHRGELVVDLRGGIADRRHATPWTDRTVSVIFSCTKGLTALMVAQLVQQGRVSYETPVIEIWPEFGAAGKSEATVRDLVAHRAGLSAPRDAMTIDDIVDWDRATSLLARQRPLWEPGEGWAYHAITHGWLGGEIVRRVTGMSVGEYFRESIARPLGVDAWIGLPPEEAARVAYMWAGPSLVALTQQQELEQREPGKEWLLRAMTLGGALPPDLVGDGRGFNDPRIQAAQIPGAGGIASARALATIWASTVSRTEGVRLLDDSTLDAALAPQVDGPPVFDAPPPWPRWGMGFQLDSEARRYLTGSSFGHDGAGGQVAFADRDHELGFAFLTTAMEAVDDVRATRVIDALRETLAS